MILEERTEGRTRFLAPPVPSDTKGPLGRSPIFFNPAMEFNRDVSVCLLEALCGTEWDGPPYVGDVLAATGVRGLRMANEVSASPRVLLNEAHDDAPPVLERNIELNSLQDRVSFRNTDAREVLARERFDYVDIDPYGSPATFLDAFVEGQDGCVAGITATDTAVLMGAKPKACMKRYGARPMRAPFMHEIGLRILIGAVVRKAAERGFAFAPILSHASDHYLRTYGRLHAGGGDAALDDIGFIRYDRARLTTTVHRGTEPPEGEHAGPLWLGPLSDGAVLEAMAPKDHMGSLRKLENVLGVWRGEAGMPMLYFTMKELGRVTRCDPPKLGTLIEALQGKGRSASRTHFSPIAIKTDAVAQEVMETYKELS